MNNEDPQRIEISDVQPGTRLELLNRTGKAQKYTVECGEYGAVSFNVIIGGTFSYTVGDVVAKITIDDVD